MHLFSCSALREWRGGRVAEGSGLENRRSESYRGFESHPLRLELDQGVGLNRYRLKHLRGVVELTWRGGRVAEGAPLLRE